LRILAEQLSLFRFKVSAIGGGLQFTLLLMGTSTCCPKIGPYLFFCGSGSGGAQGGLRRAPLRNMVMPVFALIAEDAVADYLVVDRDKLGIQFGRRQNHIIVCMRFLGKRVSGGR